MALPWVRLDTNIGSHDKVLSLLAERDGPKAFVLYICGLGYAGGHGTDGLIQFAALPFVHGTKRTAELLVQHHLWTPDQCGWRIVNYAKRQQLTAAQKVILNSRRVAGAKGNCVRWHGSECGCWAAS